MKHKKDWGPGFKDTALANEFKRRLAWWAGILAERTYEDAMEEAAKICSDLGSKKFFDSAYQECRHGISVSKYGYANRRRHREAALRARKGEDRL